MFKILVTGGAGYIGSYMCKYLSKKGYEPVVLDNLIYGHREAVKWGPFFEGCISDSKQLDRIFTEHDISAVMHFAGFCYVGESVKDPAKYYTNNVVKTLKLLQSMIKNNILKIIFSSSCATYGEPVEIPITENHPQNPINPYGRSKLMVERILKDFHDAYGLKSVSLRYFNAAGADPDCEIGEDHRPETHIIPLILKTALGQRERFQIYGGDYPTNDGTCVRDYIHIDDLAQAHFLALEILLNGKDVGEAYNLGNGEGYSNKEVAETAMAVTGRNIDFEIVSRRAGDPAVLIGSGARATNDLGWKSRFPDLKSIIETAWNWHKKHPGGYSD
jgi:UDP-glucose-4-epimerase GalE